MKRTYTIHAIQHVEAPKPTIGTVLGGTTPQPSTRVLLKDASGWPYVTELPGTWTLEDLGVFTEEPDLEDAAAADDLGPWNSGENIRVSDLGAWTSDEVQRMRSAINGLRNWVIGADTRDECCQLALDKVASILRDQQLLLSGIQFTPKDDIVRPGKRISPRQAMEAAQAAVEAGETAGRIIFRTEHDPEAQEKMISLNVGGH